MQVKHTILLRNLYAGQEASVRTGHGTQTGSKLEKEYVKAVYCHLAYLTYLQSTSCEITGSVKDQLELRFQGKLSITSDMQMVLFLSESEEKLKNLLMKMKEESEKADLKLSIQKTKIMTSGPTTSWQIVGETMETVTDFILGGSKITADGDCSHKLDDACSLEDEL